MVPQVNQVPLATKVGRERLVLLVLEDPLEFQGNVV